MFPAWPLTATSRSKPERSAERITSSTTASRVAGRSESVAPRFALSRSAAAARQLGGWIERMPGDADARILLARALAGENRAGEAYAHLQLVLTQLRPGDPEARWELGQLEERRGRTDAAFEQYEEAARARPRDPRPLRRGTAPIGAPCRSPG